MCKFIVLEKEIELKKGELINALKGLIGTEIKRNDGLVKTIESFEGDDIILSGNGKANKYNLDVVCQYYVFEGDISELVKEYTTLLDKSKNIVKRLTKIKSSDVDVRENLWNYINSKVPCGDITNVRIGGINNDPQYLAISLKDGVVGDKWGKVNIGFKVSYSKLGIFVIFHGNDCNEKRTEFVEFVNGLNGKSHNASPATDDSKNDAGVKIEDGYILDINTPLEDAFNYLYELLRDVIYLINC